jgi:hypothetical protein
MLIKESKERIMIEVRNIVEALEFLKTSQCTDLIYRKACEYLVGHRGEIKENIFIHCIPGTDWEWVRQGSVELCVCGCLRVILPKS